MKRLLLKFTFGGFFFFVLSELLNLDTINSLIITVSFFTFFFFAVRFNKAFKIFAYSYCSLICLFTFLTTYQQWSTVTTKLSSLFYL